MTLLSHLCFCLVSFHFYKRKEECYRKLMFSIYSRIKIINKKKQLTFRYITNVSYFTIITNVQMSSPTLANIQKALTLYGNSTFFILGNIGNVFIVILFSQQRSTACSIYLSSSAVMNFVFLTANGYFQIFPFNYSDGTIRVITFCKRYAYILNILGQAAKTMLIFACIDRFLITSNRASFRAFSTPNREKYLVFFSFLF